MKTFLVQDLRILSRREKTAKQILFHPKATILKGENDTGKSSVLKSIPWCLGAEPAKKNPVWDGLDIVAALRFSIDSKNFTAVRHASRFGILNDDGKVVVSTDSVGADLAPFMAKEAGFDLLLNGRDNVTAIPPPAFWLLPFYTDQDKGWNGTWCSFGNLGQFKDYKVHVSEYHIGLRHNEYYRLLATLNSAKARLEEPKIQERGLCNALEKVRTRNAGLTVDFNLERFESEVSELVSVADDLAKDEEEFRRLLAKLSNQLTFVTHQLEVASAVRRELSSDYNLATNQPVQVECPTCGAVYENCVAERFKIALDEYECQRMSNDLQNQRQIIEKGLERHKSSLASVRDRHERVWQLLATKRETMTLHEMLIGEARGQAVEAIQAEVNSVRALIAELEEQSAELRNKIDALDSRDRRDAFLTRFWGLFNSNCIRLRVAAQENIRKFAPPLNDTGSDLPRLVLAHNFAVISMAWQGGTCARGAIILDSPHQQDPDPVNRKTVCDFIKDKMPLDGQLILALVDDCDVDFGGTVLELKNKRSLLDEDAFKTVGKELESLVGLLYEFSTNDSGE